MRNANQARRYFQRLADRERTRAALARRNGDEVVARRHEEQAAIYERRRDEAK